MYGSRLGVLMLETRFPRILGDMGNALTWPFPVLFKMVVGASPQRVVIERAEGLLEPFLAGAEELVRMGADGIATNCGFLSLFQSELAARCDLPVASSSLMQAPFIERLLPPGRRVGIITVPGESLTAEHLVAAGVADTPVLGTEGGEELTRVLLNDEMRLDVEAAERDVLRAGEALVGAIVLECTNMAPYAAALREHLSLPVYDMYSFPACPAHAHKRPVTPVGDRKPSSRRWARSRWSAPGITASTATAGSARANARSAWKTPRSRRRSYA